METATERPTITPVPSTMHSEIQTKRLKLDKQLTNITTIIFQNQLTTNASAGTRLNSNSQETGDYTLSPKRNASLVPLAGSNMYNISTTTIYPVTPVIVKILQMSRGLIENQTSVDGSTNTNLFYSPISTTAIIKKKDVVPNNTNTAYSTATLHNSTIRSYDTSKLTSMLTSRVISNFTMPISPSDSRTERLVKTDSQSQNASLAFDKVYLHSTTNNPSLAGITNTLPGIGVPETYTTRTPNSSTNTASSTLQSSRPTYETTKGSVFKTSQILQSVLSSSSQTDNVQSSTNSPKRNSFLKSLSTPIIELAKPSNYAGYATTKSYSSLLTHETKDDTKSVKGGSSVARTSFTMTRREFEQPTAATFVIIPSIKLNTPTKLSSAKPSSETGNLDGNLGFSSSTSDRNAKQTRPFLWGIGVSIFILFVVCIGSLILWKLKRRQRQKPPAIELVREIKTDDTSAFKEEQLNLRLNKLEVIPECVDNPALDMNETDT